MATTQQTAQDILDALANLVVCEIDRPVELQEGQNRIRYPSPKEIVDAYSRLAKTQSEISLVTDACIFTSVGTG